MIAKIAYLTTPASGVFILNIQPEGSDDILRFEISRAHLTNILIDGTAVALREHQYPHRVPSNPNQENADVHDRRQQPA
jgi:hypothetical protein